MAAIDQTLLTILIMFNVTLQSIILGLLIGVIIYGNAKAGLIHGIALAAGLLTALFVISKFLGPALAELFSGPET